MKPDPCEIDRAARCLCKGVVEVRLPKAGRQGTISGYFNDLDRLTRAITSADGKAPGVYITLNPVNPALLGRADNRLKIHAEQTTADADIEYRRWLLIDCDPKRPPGISSSDREHELALTHARHVQQMLLNRGWPAPIVADSGNGAHLLFRLNDLPNDRASTDLIKSVLETLALQSSVEHVDIDRTVFNASRIVKAYGTVARKGDATSERPHRTSRLLEVPGEILPVSRDLLESLAVIAGRVGGDESSKRNQPFDLGAWILESGLELVGDPVIDSNGTHKWILKQCPFDPSHTAPDAAIFRGTDGRIGFHCFHNSCSKNDWYALHRLVEARANSTNRPRGNGRRLRSQADQLLEIGDQFEIFHSPDGTGYATVQVARHRETWPLASSDFEFLWKREFYTAHKQAPSTQAYQDARSLLQAKAYWDSAERNVFIRVGGLEDVIYIDLGNREWQSVEITRSGWRVVDYAPVRFRRTRAMLPLALPSEGGSMDELRSVVGVISEPDWILLCSFLVAACKPEGPFPTLDINGVQGSGKSTIARILREILDPSNIPIRAAPRDERDMMIAAKNAWVLAYDNLSKVSPWFADALCRLATGSGFATRQLHTDDAEALFVAARPVILNGIEQLAERADLADRTITLTLSPISLSARQTESELLQRFRRLRPRLEGALYTAVSVALREVPNVQLGSMPRLADFAVWAAAAESGFGFESGSSLRAYAANRAETTQEALESDDVAIVIESFMEGRQQWSGNAQELLQSISGVMTNLVRKSVTTPHALGGRLRRLAVLFQSRGIEIRFARTGHAGTRVITITKSELHNVSSVSSSRGNA